MTVNDPETYRKYTALTPATLERHGGRFLTRGDAVETVEGGPVFEERLVILEFPDRRPRSHGITTPIIKALRRSAGWPPRDG